MNEMHRLEKQKSQAGQTTVEYILIVALSVTIILGLMSQFYKPFGNWMQDYMGQYLECLLDVGELPTVADLTVASATRSSALFQSLADALPSALAARITEETRIVTATKHQTLQGILREMPEAEPGPVPLSPTVREVDHESLSLLGNAVVLTESEADRGTETGKSWKNCPLRST
jgi:hypothetical protein